VDRAVDSFVNGRVSVSCGLLTEIVVNGEYRPGDLAPGTDKLHVTVTVLGPSWTSAETVTLYANGCRIYEADITDGNRAGVKWKKEMVFPASSHDVHLVAIATGPGVSALYWPIAKPYQQTSPDVRRHVIGSTGPVWIDGDGDGKRTVAREYAARLRKQFPDPTAFVKSLAKYDEAVAIQAAGILAADGHLVWDADLLEAARDSGPHVTRGFQAFIAAWKETQTARPQER
jgi:hypothetical protein